VFVPGVLANVGGELATLVADGRAEHGTRVCILFEWVAGRSLRTCMTGPRAVALGRLSARPHQDGAVWSPSGVINVLRADHVLYWQVPDQLAAAGSRFGFRALFTDARARAQSLLDALWRDPMNTPLPVSVLVSLGQPPLPSSQDTESRATPWPPATKLRGQPSIALCSRSGRRDLRRSRAQASGQSQELHHS
jgi:hypothetical protein